MIYSCSANSSILGYLVITELSEIFLEIFYCLPLDPELLFLFFGGLLVKNEATTEIIKSFGKEPQPSVGKSETKRLIKQLLMQETFSRYLGNHACSFLRLFALVRG